MKPEFEQLLRQEGRVVLMRTDGGEELTDEVWAQAAKQTRQTIAALVPDFRWDGPNGEEAIRTLAERLYLDFEEDFYGK